MKTETTIKPWLIIIFLVLAGSLFAAVSQNAYAGELTTVSVFASHVD